ncbi:PHB depolymerase family esterase [Methylobacterium sp. BTF04]|uniref:extracellular catalytic domain type 1 short-chain-length polyhydroxyalkanoate depolymerase n=1 Tax=Methylobacterium sp. BTF04 TaxID=2708300 RepID=UPI0013D0761D|nr:PHB depolymerase family esterase [Methylobacterium sp. BTF04]NEU10657.1 PHB depolymerase family esterase [Methylobacterium sp. BTF04]
MSDQHNRMQDRLADMAEATRLTVAGRLHEATVVLQRGLSGAPAQHSSGTTPQTIDLVAERIDDPSSTAQSAPREHTAPRSSESGLAAVLPERLRKIVETVTQGLAPVLEGLKGGGLGAGNGLPGSGFAGTGLGGAGLAGTGLAGTGLGTKAFRGTGFARPSGRPVATEGGGAFVDGAFANDQGARDYKLFIPSEAGPDRPLVVMLHGCSQSPDDFAAGTAMNALAEAQGFFVVYPGQSGRANGQRCWNWFQPGDQGRDSGEAGIIAGLTRKVMVEHGIDPHRVYIAGLSAGAAAAANIARVYPDLYAAVGIHSGLAAGCARDVSTALTVMRLGPVAAADCDAGDIRMPTIVFHGESDGTVHPSNGEQALVQAGIHGLKPMADEGASPGGLPYIRTRYADATGRVTVESWMVRGLGHAWSGGSSSGSYTDPRGPDASRAMVDFFMEHPLA